MIRIAALAVVLAGCNAVFGLDEPSGTDAGVAPTAAGSVTALSLDFMSPEGAASSFVLNAEFGPPSSTCSELDRVGGCAIVACASTPAPRPDAGAITFTGALTGTLLPGADGTYVPIGQSGRLFVAGQPLRIQASGATVPAFDTTMATPMQVTFSTVLPSPSGNPLTIERGVDLTLAWSGGDIGQVAIELDPTTGDAKLGCLFPVGAGTGTIATTLLAQLPAGSAAFSTGVATSEQVIRGTYSIQLLRGVVGLRDDGDWAAGSVELQ